MDIMVFIVLSRALLLVSLIHLCTRSVEGEHVDIDTLAKITRFFHQNYEIGQYAVAINVPKNQCEKGFLPSRSSFLKEDKKENVRNIIHAEENPVYEGKELIAAGVQKTPKPAHSEYLLMNPANNSPLTRLLNKRKDGCVVFYTLNSPCMNTCLSGKYNIIGGLDKLKALKGIKAFAFKNIWSQDQSRKNELKEKLQLIASRVPLYRCKESSCTLCGEPGSNIEINTACLTA